MSVGREYINHFKDIDGLYLKPLLLHSNCLSLCTLIFSDDFLIKYVWNIICYKSNYKIETFGNPQSF